MSDRLGVRQGTLAPMALKTLGRMGPPHGCGMARRREQTSGDLPSVDHGTLYAALLKPEQEGYVFPGGASPTTTARLRITS